MIIVHLCSLIIFLVIAGCWVFPKKITIDKKPLFPILLVLTLISILFDMFMTYVFMTMDISMSTKELIFKIYSIGTYCIAYFQFVYLVNESLEKEIKKKITIYSFLVPVFISILVMLFDVEIEILPNGINIRGLSTICCYFGIILIEALVLYILIKYKNSINRWHKMCYRSIVAVWILFLVVQLLSSRLGYVSMAIITSLIPLFAFIENPLNYIDYKYSCFKNNFIESTLKMIINSTQGGFVIWADIDDTNRTSNSHQIIATFKKELIRTLSKRDAVNVFITEKNEIFIIGEKTNEYLLYKDMINITIENFYKRFENKQSFRAMTICCNNVKMFSHETEVIDHLKYTQQRLSNNYYYNIIFEITNTDIDSMQNEKTIKDEIMMAYAQDRIEAYIQPIYSVEKKKIVSAEALARIRKSDGTIMLPYEFIPVSEKYGLDILIGFRIIEKICQFMHDPVAGKLFEFVDINLSIAQCEASNLSAKIIGITQKYDIKPNRLNFEITETGFINKMANIEANIRTLTSYGFGFSLDDFGNGESNLNYLIKMPVSNVKLDMHMIWDYFKNDRAKKTVQTIIKISHGMKLKIVAEGVETAEQLEELSNQGVDLIQGYYFYKPMPITEYLEIVKREKRQVEIDSKGSENAMVNEKVSSVSNENKVKSNVIDLAKQSGILDSIFCLSNIFLTMHLLDLNERTVQEFSALDNQHVTVKKDIDIQDLLNSIMTKTAKAQWQTKAHEFINLSTLPIRIKDKTYISLEFEGNVHGWTRAYLVPVSFDPAGNVNKIWYLTQYIDEDKRRIEVLEVLSNTDELTNLQNRRAFDKKIETMKFQPQSNMAVVTFDLNNLKYTNDNFGHHAGDELIKAAANSMRKHLERFGNIYRTGGDEFVAILSGNVADINTALEQMKIENENWKSNDFNSKLSVAYGLSTSYDIREGNFYDYEKFAENRMFKDKTQYYVDNNIDRRKNRTDRRSGTDRRN